MCGAEVAEQPAVSALTAVGQATPAANAEEDAKETKLPEAQDKQAKTVGDSVQGLSAPDTQVESPKGPRSL